LISFGTWAIFPQPREINLTIDLDASHYLYIVIVYNCHYQPAYPREADAADAVRENVGTDGGVRVGSSVVGGEVRTVPVCYLSVTTRFYTVSRKTAPSFPDYATSLNKKLSYRRETARQLPTWSGLGPQAHSPAAAPSGYTYAYGQIQNPQQTYVKRAVH